MEIVFAAGVERKSRVLLFAWLRRKARGRNDGKIDSSPAAGSAQVGDLLHVVARFPVSIFTSRTLNAIQWDSISLSFECFRRRNDRGAEIFLCKQPARREEASVVPDPEFKLAK